TSECFIRMFADSIVGRSTETITSRGPPADWIASLSRWTHQLQVCAADGWTLNTTALPAATMPIALHRMVSVGNAVVFNVHPSAAQTCNWCVHLLNEAIQAAGGPRDVITSIERPTIESANTLMKHPLVRIVVVTGGPAVVKQAMNSGKKSICAGPGNPPAVVDETGNLDKAADASVRGASLDNNIVCIAEKEVIAVDSIANRLIEQLKRQKVLWLDQRQAKELEKVVLEG